MSALYSDFLTNKKRIIHKWTHYFPIYQRHFQPFVNRSVTLIEIGVYKGGSLQLWKRFLGPLAQVVGIDIDPQCRQFEEDQIAVRIGHQGDPAFLAAVLEEFGPADIVLDDGSHVMADIKASFHYLYPRLPKNGVYMVEDLHTAYWSEFGGGLRSPDTFVELCKSLIDELNADHTRGRLAPTDFTRSTLSMHFYDSVVVFERGRHIKKHALRTGGTGLFEALGPGGAGRP